MKKVTLIFALLLTAFSYAQTGSIVGAITDKDFNNEPLPFANVLIQGTTKGTSSDIDGLFALENLEPGDYKVEFSFIGYETQVVNANVVANKVTEINIPLGASAAQLDDVIITTTVSRESETALLLEQKKAVEMKQSIGAEELSRKGVSDVATAVTKTTGISKQEGSGSVVVRGLGDRYNSTTMNGLPLPSNNASRKNIDLNIFSTDIVEAIDISKTFSSRNYGDFAGANVDIVSKNHKGKSYLEIGLGLGQNTNALNASNFKLQDGPNKSGFYSIDYPNNPLSNYNFTTSWNTNNNTPLNNDFSLSGGTKFNIGEESRLSIFATAKHTNDWTYIEGVGRSVNRQAIATKDLQEETFNYNTNSTGMVNLNYKINSSNSLSFNSLYVNSTAQQHSEFNGVINNFDQAPNGGGFVRRSTFTRNQILINQLLGNHDISERLNFDWGISYNTVNNSIPDRLQNTLVPIDDDNLDGTLIYSDLAQSDNHRFYQTLKEDEIAGNFALSLKFNKNEEEEYKGKATLGYSVRGKNIDFEATQFNFKVNQPVIADLNNIDAFFTQNNLDLGVYQIRTFRGDASIDNALEPQTYEGYQNIHSGFTTLDYKFSPKFSAIVGVRADVISQYIEWDTSINEGENNELEYQVEFMPNASLRYALNDKQNLRFASSKTYTLPQFKERAPFQYEEILNVYIGNPDLYTSTDYNFDLKWELFPSNGEVLSLTALAKFIENPINEVIIASATNDISWVNSGELATAYGLEAEVKIDAYNFNGKDADLDNKLSYGLNVSYLNTNQDLDSDKVNEETNLNVLFTDNEDRLTGASDLLVNTDITYIKEFTENSNIQATLAANYFSDRVFALGTARRGAFVDDEVITLDFIVKSKINEKLTLGLSCRNLLDPTIERFQRDQDVVLQSYKKGLNFGLSLKYKI